MRDTFPIRSRQVSFWALTFVEAPAGGSSTAPASATGTAPATGTAGNGSGLLPAVAASPHAPWLLNPLPAQATLTFNVHANGAVRDCAAHHALGIAVSVANDGYVRVEEWSQGIERVPCYHGKDSKHANGPSNF